jgi:UDP-glucose 4-epimerase
MKKSSVLITGGAGFIGSHLAEELLHKGHEVTALDNLSTGRLENVAHLEKTPGFRLVIGDILNETLVDKLVEQSEWVFHLAAAVGVELIVKDPIGVLTTNIKGSEVVIETAYRYRRKILIASTSEIYGKNSKGPLKEDDDRILGSTTKSRWSYSTSKAVDEILAYTYWKEKQLPAIIVRLFNTVGPRQTGHYGMVIPRFVEQALKGKDITVYGDGTQTRCFLYVKDVARAMVKLMETPEAVGQVFNLGSQQEVSIHELARKVVEMAGSSSRVVFVPYDEAYEEGFEDMQRRVPDTSKAAAMIGFKPTADLEAILKMVVKDLEQKMSDR